MRFLFKVILVLGFLCSALPSFAASFAGSAESGAVVVSGNNESESYNAKSKLTYSLEKNAYSVFGRYLRSTSLGVESARNWEAGARYERELSEAFGLIGGHKAESDIFNGYLQRDSSDVGLKYFLTKNESSSWILELGYRYQKTLPTIGNVSHDNLTRIYTELNKNIDTRLTLKYWAEYLPKFTDPDAYLANTEASLNIMINSVFSLKIAYLLQYQNVLAASTSYTTKTTTMNLVANF